jgi:quercetin dioxygenase-like cupin family protein/DNA-binding Xre family transcriptional regulator
MTAGFLTVNPCFIKDPRVSSEVGAVPSASNGNGAPDAVPDGTRIGAQLRAARLAARMSMAEVAEQAGLTKGFVSKLERDLANVSVASLIRLCDALGVSVGSLFQAPAGEVIRRGAYPPINFGGRKMTEYLLTPSGEKRVQAILSDIEPGGGSGGDPYALPADVEFVYVLAGQLQVTVAGEQITLDQGDAFTFPANTQHTFRATPQAGRTQVLWVVSPALPDAPLYAQPPASQHAGEQDEPDHEHEPAKDGRPS